MNFPFSEGWERVRIETRGRELTQEEALVIAARCQPGDTAQYEVGSFEQRSHDVRIIYRLRKKGRG